MVLLGSNAGVASNQAATATKQNCLEQPQLHSSSSSKELLQMFPQDPQQLLVSCCHHLAGLYVNLPADELLRHYHQQLGGTRGGPSLWLSEVASGNSRCESWTCVLVTALAAVSIAACPICCKHTAQEGCIQAVSARRYTCLGKLQACGYFSHVCCSVDFQVTIGLINQQELFLFALIPLIHAQALFHCCTCRCGVTSYLGYWTCIKCRWCRRRDR